MLNLKSLSIETLIELWELSDKRNEPEVPTVRGWIMDAMELKNPKAFENWMTGDASMPARSYFL